MLSQLEEIHRTGGNSAVNEFIQALSEEEREQLYAESVQFINRIAVVWQNIKEQLKEQLDETVAEIRGIFDRLMDEYGA